MSTYKWSGSSNLAFYNNGASHSVAAVGKYSNSYNWVQKLVFKTGSVCETKFSFTWTPVSVRSGSASNMSFYITTEDTTANRNIKSGGTQMSRNGYVHTASGSYIFNPNTTYYIFIYGTSSGSTYNYASGSTWGSAVLETTAQPSKLSADSGELGKSQTLTVTAYDSSFTHSITYKCGDESGTIVSGSKEAKVTWTPPLALAKANTTGATVTATLTLTTYSGSTAIGTHNLSVLYTIGDDFVPTFTAAITDDAGYKNQYGYFIQLRSRMKIKVNATALHGATIKEYKITANGESFTEAEAITDELTQSGNVQVYVFVRDSRGKTAEQYFDVSIKAYSPPVVSSPTVKRCDSDGTENDQGAYVQVKFTASVTSLDGQNIAKYQLAYKKTTESIYTNINLTEYENDSSVSGETYIFAANTGSSYNVQFTVTDAFGAVIKTTVASTAATIMHFPTSGKGMGLGKVTEIEESVDVGWKIYMNGYRIMRVGDPEEDTDAVSKSYTKRMFLEMVYPVGSVYTSVNNVSPASFLGGAWEQLSSTDYTWKRVE